MNKENTQKLFNRFSFYKPQRPVTQSLMGFGFECGDGWFDLIWKLSEDIENELKNEDSRIQIKQRLKDDPPFEVIQVKEKFGELRFYANGGNDKIQDLIDSAERKSVQICENCGKPGKTRGEGWITTLCDECNKRQE
jgi:hypothetical protein